VTNGPWGATLDNTPTFTYQGNDTDGFVVGYYVSIDQNPPTEWTTNTTWTSPELENGSHTFYVIAQDDDGTNSSVVPHSFVITDVTGIIFVNGTGGDNTNDGSSWALAVKTIQRGIDLAGASGWMVLVANGTYKGDGNKNIDFGGKDIYLKSNGTSDTCIIDCEYNGRGIYLHSGETQASVIEGFTITHGRITAKGGAISCSTGITVSRCRLTANETLGSTHSGAGIWFAPGADGLIVDCTIDNNHADQAGGGIMTRDGNVTITIMNTVIKENFAGVDGGGMFIWDAILTMDNCLVANNSTPYGGGILLTMQTDATITRTSIINNRSSNAAGGGLRCDGSVSVNMSSCLIANNSAINNYGGGVFFTGSGNCSIVNCTISGNSARDGGGVYVSSTDAPVFSNCIIWDNYCRDNGREIYASSAIILNYSSYPDNLMNSFNLFNPGNLTENNCFSNAPQFVAPEVTNYTLYISSPCINIGCNSLVPPQSVSGLGGNPRILEGTVDLGAYEWATPGGNIPPGVTIVDGPQDNVFGDTHSFTYKGYDADGSVTGYFVSVDTYPPDVWTTQNSWTTPAVSYGQHTFYVIARDNTGDNSSVMSRKYFVMSTPPTIQITGGPYGPTVDNTAYFTYSATDSDGTIAGYYVSLDGMLPDTWTTDSFYTTPELGDGVYRFSVKAQDNTGTNSGMAERTFIVKNITKTIFVNGLSGDNSNDGSSWPLAVKTIQRGIDLAGASGHMVLVADGTYTGDGNKNIDFNGKNVYLKSNGDANTCIIDCEYDGRGFYLHSGETRESIIEGFTIRRARVNAKGGAISCSSGVTLFGCRLTENETLGSSNSGAGIWFAPGSNGMVIDCTIDNNHADQAGGGIMTRDGNVTITIINSIIRDNYAGVDGGGMFIWSAILNIDNCLIENNETPFGGGILLTYRTYATIKKTRILNNRSTSSSGGGILCDDVASLFMINCLIENNSALNASGGGLHISGSESCSIVGCTIVNNNANRGGGVYISRPYAKFINTIIWNNNAGTEAKQIYADNDIEFHNCNFGDNSSDPDNVVGFQRIALTDCLHANPLFVSVPGGNFRLSSGSPCIDKGNNIFIIYNRFRDLDGNPRIVDGVAPFDGVKVDIGAYEYQP
jgi:parallel beta-helix repeat protein